MVTLPPPPGRAPERPLVSAEGARRLPRPGVTSGHTAPTTWPRSRATSGHWGGDKASPAPRSDQWSHCLHHLPGSRATSGHWGGDKASPAPPDRPVVAYAEGRRCGRPARSAGRLASYVQSARGLRTHGLTGQAVRPLSDLNRQVVRPLRDFARRVTRPLRHPRHRVVHRGRIPHSPSRWTTKRSRSDNESPDWYE